MTTAAPDPTADFLALSYRPDLLLLTVRWLRAVSFAELQLGFEQARAAGQHYQATRWLVDVRRRTELDAAGSRWVAEQFLPQAAASLAPAALHVAYLLSPARDEQLRLDPGLHAAVDVAQAPERPYRLRTFLDEGPAVGWLLSQS